MKNYCFKWFKKERYRKPNTRLNIIHAENPKDATSAFMKVFGNLKKNSIISIQEVKDNGQHIGEPILPD